MQSGSEEQHSIANYDGITRRDFAILAASGASCLLLSNSALANVSVWYDAGAPSAEAKLSSAELGSFNSEIDIIELNLTQIDLNRRFCHPDGRHLAGEIRQGVPRDNQYRYNMMVASMMAPIVEAFFAVALPFVPGFVVGTKTTRAFYKAMTEGFVDSLLESTLETFGYEKDLKSLLQKGKRQQEFLESIKNKLENELKSIGESIESFDADEFAETFVNEWMSKEMGVIK